MRTIETERLILRAWRLEDVDDMYEYAKHPDVGPWAGWEPHSSKEASLKILRSFIENDEVWAIELKGNGKVIGSLGIHPDKGRMNDSAKSIGYVLSADYWGRGLMTEAVKCAIEYAFDDMSIDLLAVYHYPANARSKRVIEKCGFQYEGTLRAAQVIYDGQVLDAVCYSMLSSEYLQNVHCPSSHSSRAITFK